MKLEKFKAIIKSVDYKEITTATLDNASIYYARLETTCFEDGDGTAIEQAEYLATTKKQKKIMPKIDLENLIDCVEPDQLKENNTIYYAKITALERKKGRKPRKNKFNITAYLTEEEYDKKIIDVGDILEFNNVKMLAKDFTLSVYDKEKLTEYPNSRLHKDATSGRTYGEIKLNDIRLGCSQGSWKIFEKFDEQQYWIINKVKFYCESKDELLGTTKFEFYITKSEVDKLKEYNNKETIMRAYVHKQAVQKALVQVYLEKIDGMDKYYCKLTKIGEIVKEQEQE